MDSKTLHKIAGEYAKKIAKDKRLEESAADTLVVGALIKFYLEQSIASHVKANERTGIVFVAGDASTVDVVSSIDTTVGGGG